MRHVGDTKRCVTQIFYEEHAFALGHAVMTSADHVQAKGNNHIFLH
ncbi:unnamed protein product [Chondrus crispus]|uniref:Uncharacterized protein n=1 Tax=Chondrus crispus TaxID=2769 RepID=R7QPW4_CHOCR|nr:unnamed protein product [Chondrus crispus]CDF40517.1 unnamed protein product [Chondrus crispus]|eukprot:XP_005710811.1 unnamed protein product [Chondrus crispus]